MSSVGVTIEENGSQYLIKVYDANENGIIKFTTSDVVDHDNVVFQGSFQVDDENVVISFGDIYSGDPALLKQVVGEISLQINDETPI